MDTNSRTRCPGATLARSAHPASTAGDTGSERNQPLLPGLRFSAAVADALGHPTAPDPADGVDDIPGVGDEPAPSATEPDRYTAGVELPVQPDPTTSRAATNTGPDTARRCSSLLRTR